MKARKVQPVAYAEVYHNSIDFRVYDDGRVLWDEYDTGDFESCPDWYDDYDEIKKAGLKVMK